MDKKNLWKKNKKNYSKAELIFYSAPFRRKCSLAGLTHGGMSDAQEIATLSDFFGVAGRTVRRWLNDEVIPHPCAVGLLNNLYMGFPQHGRWQGWQLTHDYLVTPSSETISPDMIGKLWLWRNEKSALQQRVNALSFENERLKRMGAPHTQQVIQNAISTLSSVIETPRFKTA